MLGKLAGHTALTSWSRRPSQGQVIQMLPRQLNIRPYASAATTACPRLTTRMASPTLRPRQKLLHRRNLVATAVGLVTSLSQIEVAALSDLRSADVLAFDCEGESMANWLHVTRLAAR